MFRKLFLAVVGLGLALASAASAADKPIYAPPPAWVKSVPIPAKAADAGGAATQFLLQNSQLHFGPDGDESYQEFAVKVLTAQGLSAVGNFILPWRPDTDTLTIHRLNIIRDGQTIDLLDGGKTVTVLRRETNLELSMLDGALTATIQPEGLQVGDVIDMAYTLRSKDPVLKDHSIGFAQLLRPGVVQRAYFRALWPGSKPIHWRATEGMGKPSLTQTADGQELTLDESGVEAPKPPTGAPARFNDLAQLEFSEFASWSQVSALMAPLYAKAQTVAPNSPIKAEIDRIAAASTDPKARAAAALKLVEDKVRYVLLAMNNGGYVPADVDVTWTRRFADCKGKTVLLLALLKGLGIDAEPVLVSTVAGDGLNERLPLVLFDHVMVRARIAGKVYWLDGTRLGDGVIDNLSMPNYHWVLPVTAKGAELEQLSPPPYAEPHFESVVKLDARGGLDAPAPARAEHVYRGDEGVLMHLVLQSVSPTDIDKTLRAYWRGKIPWIEPNHVSFAYDEATGATMLSMDGSAKIEWGKSGDTRVFYAYDSSLGYQANFDREPSPSPDAPYAVAYPSFNRWTVTVQLPNNGVGFALINAAEDKTVAGVKYLRRSTLDANGVATIMASDQALEPEFPAGEAKSAATALTTLSQYTGGIAVDGKIGARAARPKSSSPAGPLKQPASITNPDWLTKPDGDDFANYYPARAKALGKEGRVDLSCSVTVAGTLADCAVVEDPPGFGFGDASLQIAKLFQMKPETVDGQAVSGGRFKTVIVWKLAPSAPSAPTDQNKWAATGIAQTLDHFFSLNPNCSSIGNPQIRIVDPPKNGILDIGTGDGYPSYALNNPRSKCNDKMIEGVAVSYKSNDQYIGNDSVEILILFPGGGLQRVRYNISVIK